MADAEVVLSPGDVARRLGVSPSGLRRLAAVYAEVHGELPKDASGTSRLWSPEAVRRLEAARALLSAGQARSIRDALLAVESGAAPRVEVAVQDGRVAEALGVVAARLEAVLDSNRRLEAEVAELRGELAELRAQGQPQLPEALLGSQWSAEQPQGSGGPEGQPVQAHKVRAEPGANTGPLTKATSRLEGWVLKWLRK